jgi:6-phosphogluconolactonase
MASLLVYVGTYTRIAGGGNREEGVFVFRLDTATGALTPVGSVAGLVNPAFLALDGPQRFLYAVGEVSDFGGQPGGGVSALALDPATGMPKLLNQQSTGSTGPCYLTVDNSGKWLLVANSRGGAVTVLPIGADGRLGPAAQVI